MLFKLGFGQKWTSLVMKCVRSVSYAAIVNGVPGETITPSKGLRQGDPLSPYLFLICAEGFSDMLQNVENSGARKGIVVARGGTRISHLLFANDCVIFCRAKQVEWFVISNLLLQFERDLGQTLNK